MENHKREMGNEHIDMLANMNTEQVEEMLMNFRENMSGVTKRYRHRCHCSLSYRRGPLSQSAENNCPYHRVVGF